MTAKFLPIVVAILALIEPVWAQGTQNSPLTPNRSRTYTTGQPRTPVATQPSNNPFSNPIGQGVPPAVSANPNLNSNRTNVPR